MASLAQSELTEGLKNFIRQIHLEAGGANEVHFVCASLYLFTCLATPLDLRTTMIGSQTIAHLAAAVLKKAFVSMRKWPLAERDGELAGKWRNVRWQVTLPAMSRGESLSNICSCLPECMLNPQPDQRSSRAVGPLTPFFTTEFYVELGAHSLRS